MTQARLHNFGCICPHCRRPHPAAPTRLRLTILGRAVGVCLLFWMVAGPWLLCALWRALSPHL